MSKKKAAPKKQVQPIKPYVSSRTRAAERIQRRLDRGKNA